MKLLHIFRFATFKHSSVERTSHLQFVVFLFITVAGFLAF